MPATGNQCHLESGLEQAATDDRSDRPGAEHHVTHPCSVPPAPWVGHEGAKNRAAVAASRFPSIRGDADAGRLTRRSATGTAPLQSAWHVTVQTATGEAPVTPREMQ